MINNIISILKRTNAIVTDDHFVYTSGKHGSVYINKDAIYPHTNESSTIGQLFAEKFKNMNIDIVAGPAIGGIILSQWTAHHLTKLENRNILGIYTEKTSEKNQVFTRGYDKLINKKNVLIVEDLTTTGGSVRKVIESVLNNGGKIISIGVMINRNPVLVNEKTIGYPFQSLGEISIIDYDKTDCPLCKKGVPININIGHGKKYLENNNPH
ncbi:orotate phosphoribosyltransferase [Candidatus Levyibacteriota bacterium]|nr:phosphoribosyltransferase family protein [Candidatus Levybacteria bacterium]GDX61917.1 orotate phosphoribosyltransferase [Candidatus Levybacteria bacterium]